MKNKLTLTIGIPAHNEEANIQNMIESVLMQKGELFAIKKIFVVLDGCTDKTSILVRKLANKHKLITFFEDNKQKGKAVRLNEIYKSSNTDFLLTLDADILLDRNCEIEELVKEYLLYKSANVIAGYQIPVTIHSFIGRTSNAAFNLWYGITTRVNKGNHIFNLHGSVSLMRRLFYKSFEFPIGLISDQHYLYLKAVERNPRGFRLAHKTRILFRTPSTIIDIRIQGSRAIFDEKENLRNYFGDKIESYYHISIQDKVFGLVLGIAKDPVYSFFAILLGWYIRKFPYKSNYRINSGLWEAISSSKTPIKIN